MRSFPLLIALAAILAPLASAPAAAQTASEPAASAQPAPQKQRPVTDKTITAQDVATTPISDLNLNRKAIPEVLVRATGQPYVLAGMKSCARLSTAIAELDAVLGEDIDVQQARGVRLSVGGVARSVVGSFIPFEGIIREVSGARADQQRMQLAIYAGSVRRAFLKGVGLTRGCRYPARPASAARGPAHRG